MRFTKLMCVIGLLYAGLHLQAAERASQVDSALMQAIWRGEIETVKRELAVASIFDKTLSKAGVDAVTYALGHKAWGSPSLHAEEVKRLILNHIDPVTGDNAFLHAIKTEDIERAAQLLAEPTLDFMSPQSLALYQTADIRERVARLSLSVELKAEQRQRLSRLSLALVEQQQIKSTCSSSGRHLPKLDWADLMYFCDEPVLPPVLPEEPSLTEEMVAKLILRYFASRPTEEVLTGIKQGIDRSGANLPPITRAQSVVLKFIPNVASIDSMKTGSGTSNLPGVDFTYFYHTPVDGRLKGTYLVGSLPWSLAGQRAIQTSKVFLQKEHMVVLVEVWAKREDCADREPMALQELEISSIEQLHTLASGE